MDAFSIVPDSSFGLVLLASFVALGEFAAHFFSLVLGYPICRFEYAKVQRLRDESAWHLGTAIGVGYAVFWGVGYLTG